MPATSNRMATQRKIQAIQLKATGILEGLFDSQRSSRLPHSTAKLHDAMMTVADGGRCLLQHFEGAGAARRWKSAIERGEIGLGEGQIERGPVHARMRGHTRHVSSHR